MKVLLVNDNPQMRRMVKRYLRDLAEETRECNDADKAVAAYIDFQPDWVLMDWEMKRLNGIQATQRILADFPQAQICVLTNHTEEELRAAAVQAGVQGYILKDELMDLRRLLSGSAHVPLSRSGVLQNAEVQP